VSTAIDFNEHKLYEESSKVANDAVGSIRKTSINLNINVAILIFVSGFRWSGRL